jgi:threonine dehydrogenase-like Zn-dependent dehydrogenase
VADWLLSCRDKALQPCGRCREGNEQVCERWLEGGSSGYGFGFDARYGGGWAEELVTPARRVHRIPAGMVDEVAVLAEPFGVGVHAVARHFPRSGRVLVIGPGAIGLAVITALAHLAPDADVTAAGVHPASEELARRAGAAAFLLGGRNDLITAAAAHTSGRLRGNRLSGPVLDGGFDVVFDTIGLPQTIDDALRVVRPRGKVVLVGTAARQAMDWTLVWSREVTVAGSAYAGQDTVPDGARLPAGPRASMQVALELLADTQPRHLLTHAYPLSEPVTALETATAGPAAGAVKVAFVPQRVEAEAAA